MPDKLVLWIVAQTCPLLEQKQHVNCWSSSGLEVAWYVSGSKIMS